MKDSKIEWTDHTFNPWIGCTKVSEACNLCYAQTWADTRYGWAKWGPGQPRKRTSAANWKGPLAWNRRASESGQRARVFCASLADVFDSEVASDWRADLWEVIQSTPNLDWLLLTKRPQNITEMLPRNWGSGWPNVWLGVTAETQRRADERLKLLLQIPARIRFASCEPLFEPLNLSQFVGRGLHWVIVGGETGRTPHRLEPAWARGVRDQCNAAGAAFFFKQWGDLDAKGIRVGKTRAGRTLDGRTWNELPQGQTGVQRPEPGRRPAQKALPVRSAGRAVTK